MEVRSACQTFNFDTCIYTNCVGEAKFQNKKPNLLIYINMSNQFLELAAVGQQICIINITITSLD